MKSAVRIAVVQSGPAYLDLPQSLEKAGAFIREAAGHNTDLVVFGETWLCGYPAWLDCCPNMGLWNHEPAKQVFARMHKNGVQVPGPETRLFGKWAKTHGMVIGIGVNEIVPTGPGNGTIYNSFLLFDENGRLAIHHRKLIPTYTEKMLYGPGDAHGLKPAQTAFGSIGGLICWEHFMPLSRQALHNEGEHIHLALWPKVHEMHQVASRQYAFEGRCFVVAAGQMLRARDMPEELELPPSLADNPDEWVLNGGSCIIGPDGFFDLEPQFDKEAIIYHQIEDLDETYRERATLDTSGHYQRPDVFQFDIIRNER
ncbi:MAG: carbon-nitrogen hydrolase family protein [Saprospiraceae bacterium]